jgi:hypothetical protein
MYPCLMPFYHYRTTPRFRNIPKFLNMLKEHGLSLRDVHEDKHEPANELEIR